MIKHLDGFTVKHKEKYVIWLFKNLKKVSTETDSLGNKRVNYFNALKYCFNDDSYIKYERLAIITLILDGGRHVLCSTDIMESADQANPLDKETTSEEDKLIAIHLLQMSDPVRHGNINKELQNG